MRKVISALVIVAAVATSGCAAVRGRNSTPDEFAVARNAPLVIPPDYSLTPPVAGTVSLTAQDAQSQAIEALFGGPAPRSSTEMSVLERAGRDRASLGIRSSVGDPNTRVVDKGATTVQILTAANSSTNIASAQPGQ